MTLLQTNGRADILQRNTNTTQGFKLLLVQREVCGFRVSLELKLKPLLTSGDPSRLEKS